MILDKDRVAILSHVVAANHEQVCHGFVRIHDAHPIQTVRMFSNLEDGPMIVVRGRNLKPKKDVRRLLFQLDDEVKGDPTAMIWHTYDPLDNVSTLAIAFIGEV